MQSANSDSNYAVIEEPKPAPKKRTVKRGSKKKYVSPFRRPKAEPKEVVCNDCKLPSFPSLPPLIRVGENFIHGVGGCPEGADDILKSIIYQKKQADSIAKARQLLDFHRPGNKRWTKPRK